MSLGLDHLSRERPTADMNRPAVYGESPARVPSSRDDAPGLCYGCLWTTHLITRRQSSEPAPSDDHVDGLTGRALRLRIRQQELLAELGVLALQGTNFIEMLNHTAGITAEDWGGILQSHGIHTGRKPSSSSCRSWLERGRSGSASVGADLASPGGYALRTGKPVISEPSRK